MLSQYYTTQKSGSDEITIQKSRFIGTVRRVETEEQAQEFIEEMKKKYHDATHNCSAYMIGEHDQIQKANDDGEPSGTAGVPILEVIKKQHLKDTAIVVTRYFGGIKLGAGGLIRAYSTTASQAIKTTGMVKRQLMQGYAVTIDYTLLGKTENALRNSSYLLESIDYQEKVILHVYTKVSETQTFTQWMTELTNALADIKETEKKYLEIPVTSTKENDD
ncbi:YigZ family protein [Virgibacillus sp. 179-BFC.A HS]|uniref:YigZ family protein n=1 Tax=Tigheibacillus jepli TaxID=3035914 RepID=A0ABU5CFG9_9BACI|nr:YigZ family protein [Virgibacillus sp. 179-BFC.A HS]MDY0405079.1 YigZ family protein [Virgibacillus sp. 179-BFC.A HS]